MSRRSSFQKGQCQIKTGMVFTMPDLILLHPNGDDIQADIHPWLIANTYNDYIEIVMCTTLQSDTEEKHRYRHMDQDAIMDIKTSCPPMDPKNIRLNGISMDTAFLLPKKELFSHKLQFWTTPTKTRNFATEGLQALRLDKQELTHIQKELRNYQRTHKQPSDQTKDVYQCEDMEAYKDDLEAGFPVPNWFSKKLYNEQFAWKHLPKADPYAVYPFPNQLTKEEQTNPDIVRISTIKKERHKKRSAAKQAKQKDIEARIENMSALAKKYETALAHKYDEQQMDTPS